MKKNALKDCLITLGIFLAATGVSFLIKANFADGHYAMQVYILAVAFTALLTGGYIYGIVLSLVSVFTVNYLFTYPYFTFTLLLSGYPLTFFVMLIVSLIISTLVTRVKKQEKIRSAAEKEKTRADLLRSVSHDLRTPLASISGASSALLENKNLSEDEKRELLESINADASWLIRVTENILSVTKFTGNSASIRKKEEALEEIISDTIVKFRKNYPGVRVHVEKPDRVVFIEGDGTLLSQVLMNLFENAALHGEHVTEIEVWVSVVPDFVVVRVLDNGCGIPQEKLSAIFDGQPAMSVQPDGRRSMGIGLMVCRTIIRAHGGTIEACNRPGGGAEFRFTLPHKEEQDVC